MDPALRRLFREDAGLHAVGDGLWSALAPGGRAERYDELAAGYDRLIGSRLYQRLAWGNDPDDDVRFAREGASSASGPLLDVGCGSLLFTADVHGRSGRPSALSRPPAAPGSPHDPRPGPAPTGARRDREPPRA